jgi:vacuolar-type H+-ATPase subunit H
MLERIAEAEQQADKIIEEANIKAREQIASAKAEAEAAVAQELDAERRKTVQSMANAEERGKELRDEIIAAVRAEISEARTAAENKLSDTVSYLMERIESEL